VANQLTHLWQAVRIVWRSAPGWTAANVALVFVQGLLPLLALYLMKLVVDAITAGLSAPDPTEAFGDVMFFIALAGGVVLLTAVFDSAADLVRQYQAQLVSDHMHDVLHAKSLEMDLEYYESSQYYDKMHRAQSEASFRPNRIVNGLVRVAQSGISLLAVSALLLSLHWSMALILLAAGLPEILVQLKYSRRMFRWQRQRTPTERQAGYLHSLITRVQFAKEIRLFDLGDLFKRRSRDARRELRRERLQIVARRSAAGLLPQVGAAVAMFGCYGFVAYRTVHGMITMGDLVMYFGALQRGQTFLRGFLGGVASLYEDNLFLANLTEFLQLEPKVVQPSHPQPVPRPMKSGIVFDRVSFQYPASDNRVIDEVSIHIPRGDIVALVGENGSGKTTLIKLLCRLYDPTAGSITLDGIDLRDFDPAELRNEISVIFQDYVRYHATARDNIGFGNVNGGVNQERVAHAARYAGAHEMIESLPRGYDTMLGKLFEGGEELSIGQWQVVALARAFMRDAQIIVLDEPTSSLDARAEYETFKRFRELATGHTTVLISHRFSTMSSCRAAEPMRACLKCRPGITAEVWWLHPLPERFRLPARSAPLPAIPGDH
jgi:ATP-binding cassette subfamily B protein